MKPSHQLDKHVADPKKKTRRCDEKDEECQGEDDNDIMKSSHQFDKHVANAEKKRCRCDEEKTQAGSTTIPHLTEKKKRNKSLRRTRLNQSLQRRNVN